MLLTITSATPPATDMGYLLYKKPGRVQSFDLAFGKAYLFYTQATHSRCTVALLLDIDSVALADCQRKQGQAQAHYVNDRPFVASSFMSVAIRAVFSTALSGHSKERQLLADSTLPYVVEISVLPCWGGKALIENLFAPLGYEVKAVGSLLDEQFPRWGNSPYYQVSLKNNCRLCELLSHLYVLIPVLDDNKHYWVDETEVDKLLRRGQGWLSDHPKRELIANRYLKHQHDLTRLAFARLVDEDQPEIDIAKDKSVLQEEIIENSISLREQRLAAVICALKECQATRVVDLGCGKGDLIKALIPDESFEKILGVDVSWQILELARNWLALEKLPANRRRRVRLLQGSLLYRDRRIAGYDAATVLEVLEYFEAYNLRAFERVLFEFARPKNIVVTTPNREYNVKFNELLPGELRHVDHRFEWSREQFRSWCVSTAKHNSYSVQISPIGIQFPNVGAPTQMAVFTLIDRQRTK